MLPSDALCHLLLAAVCLCVCGNAARDVHKPPGPLGWRPWRTTAPSENETILERTARDVTFGDARGSPNPGGSTDGSSAPAWEREGEGPAIPTPPEPFLPDILPKEDGADGLWTETLTPSGAPPSRDQPTEGTMSSESLPLIFEPLEEAAASPSQQPVASEANVPARAVATETDEPRRTPPPTARDPPIRSNGAPTADILRATADPDVRTRPLCFFQSERYDAEETSDESAEDEENPSESPRTQAPYSLIPPPPPVWVRGNQGLMRSWVALIREKAGYVSGILAPVAVGIVGALILVGALYGVGRIRRRRRNSFKRQRRKVQPAEQTSEARPGLGRQDQAMLLADSSEDEF
ncbi:uncharacterized protein armh4 isoform X2 [Stigmatopora argus]